MICMTQSVHRLLWISAQTGFFLLQGGEGRGGDPVQDESFVLFFHCITWSLGYSVFWCGTLTQKRVNGHLLLFVEPLLRRLQYSEALLVVWSKVGHSGSWSLWPCRWRSWGLATQVPALKVLCTQPRSQVYLFMYVVEGVRSTSAVVLLWK